MIKEKSENIDIEELFNGGFAVYPREFTFWFINNLENISCEEDYYDYCFNFETITTKD